MSDDDAQVIQPAASEDRQDVNAAADRQSLADRIREDFNERIQDQGAFSPELLRELRDRFGPGGSMNTGGLDVLLRQSE